MTPAEFARMATVARTHWWYIGLRDCILRTISRLGMPDLHGNILDAGCGTGETLQYLQQTLQPRYVGGFDASPLALDYAVGNCPLADLYLSNICDPEIRCPDLDLILCCDVISESGLEIARCGLHSLVAGLRPEGLLVLNVPAYQWLWSRHDAAVQTRQRFNVPQIRRLMRDLGLKTELITYRICTLFPAIVLRRLPSIIWRPKDELQLHSDTVQPNKIINHACRMMLQCENAGLDRGLRYPWGSSVFAVGRKSAI